MESMDTITDESRGEWGAVIHCLSLIRREVRGVCELWSERWGFFPWMSII